MVIFKDLGLNFIFSFSIKLRKKIFWALVLLEDFCGLINMGYKTKTLNFHLELRKMQISKAENSLTKYFLH